MDEETTLDDIKQEIKNFSEKRDWNQYDTTKDLAIGLITEASELLEHFRFKTKKDIAEILDDQNKREEISDELADTLYFLAKIAIKCNFDISKAFYRKMEKNIEKYPVNKCKGKNKKYDEL